MLAVVENRELRQVFVDVKPLLAKAENDRLLTFTLGDSSLRVTAQHGMLYQRTIPTKSVDCITVTVQYEDLTGVIDEAGECSLDITSNVVYLRTASASVQLQATYAVKDAYAPASSGELFKINGNFQETVSSLTALHPLIKLLSKDPPYIFDGSYSVIKYPTVWVRETCDFMPAVLARSDAEILARFSPTGCVVDKDTLAFVKRNGVFVAPRAQAPMLEDFDCLLTGLQVRAKIAAAGLFANVKKAAASLSKGNVQLGIYETGLLICVSKPSMRVLIQHGDVQGGYIDTITIPLEYLIICAALVKDSDLEIALEGGKLWIHNHRIDILLSV
jgi:hypothetical protein